jgi:hypothetical protein
MRHHLLRAPPKVAGGGGDPWGGWPEPTLLLHMDGSNGSTTLVDSSPNNWAVSVFGNAALTTADPKFGSAWLNCNSTGYIVLPANNAFVIGTNDFTIDFWCMPSRVNGNDGLFTFGGINSGVFLCLFSSSWFAGNAGSGGTNMGAATAGQRVHVALTRKGTSVRLFIDGTQRGSTLTWSNNFTDNRLNIGHYYNANFRFVDGRIDEFRFINGTAVWTENFTPPTAPYPSP